MRRLAAMGIQQRLPKPAGQRGGNAIMILFRLLLLVAVGYGIFRTLRWLRAAPPAQRRQRYWKAGLVAFAGVVLLLAAFGRVHWIGALIVATLPVLQRLAPLALPWLQRRFTQQSRTASGEARRPESAALGRTEALAILGLTEPASREQILQAHRRLIQKLHPDQGGSDYLAARINAAREVLLNTG